MKKKRLIKGICIVILGIILCFFIRRGYFRAEEFAIINEGYYEGHEKELWYPTDPFDIPIIVDIMNTAHKAFSTIGEWTPELYEEIGKLMYYTEPSPKAVLREHELIFITGNFTEDEGYIWVKYAESSYEEDGSEFNGTCQHYARWFFEKIDDRWIMTDSYDHP